MPVGGILGFSVFQFVLSAFWAACRLQVGGERHGAAAAARPAAECQPAGQPAYLPGKCRHPGGSQGRNISIFNLY